MPSLNLNQELSVLEISGPDATTYLQGQLSNDINELDHIPFQYAAHLNNKGRILATFIISKFAPDSYYLITTHSLTDKIIPRLKMFILRSKVTLSQLETNISLNDVPPAVGHTLQLATESYLNIDLNINNSNIATKIDSNDWHKFLVEHTIPMIYINSTEKIIPQQINYDLLNGISFKKGCYTGQEIVARTHYLGKVKRRMAKFSTDSLPIIGQIVVSPLLANQEVGFIVDYYQEGNAYHGLVSLQNDCLNAAYLDSTNQHKLNCQTLITND